MNTLRILNPATGDLLSELSADTPDTIREKAALLRQRGSEWAARSVSERCQAIERFARLLEQERPSLARMLSQETGKPISASRNELTGTSGRIEYFLRHVEAMTRGRSVFTDHVSQLEERIDWEPLGLITQISAWNYPYFVGTNVFVPALLTGNRVLYKPSEHAALTGLRITELLHRAGVPEHAFQCVIGGPETGAALLDEPVPCVQFTGSHDTGKRVALAAARHLARVGLELGGKDPLYVADDSDPGLAALGAAEGAFYNTGQSCCAVERIYVHERIYDAFLPRFLSAVRAYRVGDPLEESTTLGPLARRTQLDVLESHVQDALKQGAEPLLGGKRIPGKGNYFEPTVLAGATHGMRIMREESFGPVIGIQKVSGDEEAVRWMADTPYGLTASVYSAYLDRARAVLSRLDTGTSYWNCCDRVSPRLPWSGRGHSGVGATLSQLGIQAFLQPRAWHLRSPLA